MLAISQAFDHLFGASELPKLKVHGRTDVGILSDVFAFHDANYIAHREEFNQAYWQRLPAMLHEVDGNSLPGAKTLVQQLSQHRECQLGILTGNAKRAAEIKLDHFDLAKYFKFGGYGDDFACRNEVARLAHESAQQHLGEAFSQEHVWVIGDTVNDIVCARSINAKVLAVETGGANRADLEAAEPDAIMETLEDSGQFMRHIFGENAL